MRARCLRLIAPLIAAVVAAFVLPWGDAQLPFDAQAETATSSLAAYDIDILPGVTGGNLRMTSGWHSDRYGGAAIDIAATRGNAVHARFSINKTYDEIFAVVDEVHDTSTDCRRIVILLKERRPGSDQATTIGQFHYYHVKPLIGIDPETQEKLYLRVGDRITLNAGDPSMKLGEIIASNLEPAKCTTGDHLHMSALVSGTENMWRNADRTYLMLDDGMGFDPASAAFSSTKEGYGVPYTLFCDDIWMFKLFPDSHPKKTREEWAPPGTVVGKCTAPDAPDNLRVTSGAESITLRWDDPGDSSITGYLYRIRKVGEGFPDGEGSFTLLSSKTRWKASCTNTLERSGDEAATAGRSDVWGYNNTSEADTTADATRWTRTNCDWTPISGSGSTTTTHTISAGLEADTKYVVQVRARNGSHLSDRGAIAKIEATTDSSTPAPTPTPSPPAAPTGLTATEGNGSIDLEWNDPGDASITGYEYRTKISSATTWGNWQTITGATRTTTEHTISGLTNGTTYSVQLRARNAGGPSDESSRVSATPVDPYAPPTGLSLARHATHGDRLELTYTRPTGPAAFEFELYRSDDKGSFCDPDEDDDCADPVATGSGLSPVAFDRLARAKGYKFRARGRGCQRDDTPGGSGQSGNPLLTCGNWSGWSGAVELPPPPPPDPEPTPQCTLTVQPSPAAAADPTESTHDCGDVVTPTHPPVKDACYEPSGTLSEVTMTSDRTVTANYAKIRYTLTVQPSPAEAANRATSEHDCNDEVEPSHPAVTDACYEPSGTLSEVTMTSDKTVTANYAKIRYTLTVQPSPAEAANRATSEHDCNDEVEPSHPAVTDACYEPSGTLSEVTMTSDKTVTANYRKIQYTLTVTGTPPEGGSVSGGRDYDCRVEATATATANTGYHLLVWNEEIQMPVPSSSESRTVTMDRDRSVSFGFHKNRYRLSTSSSTGGSVSGGGTYLYNDDATVTASPDDLYYFSHWTGDARGSTNPVTIRMTGNKSVHAVFGDVCDVMPEVCPASRDEDGDEEEESSPP